MALALWPGCECAGYVRAELARRHVQGALDEAGRWVTHAGLDAVGLTVAEATEHAWANLDVAVRLAQVRRRLGLTQLLSTALQPGSPSGVPRRHPDADWLHPEGRNAEGTADSSIRWVTELGLLLYGLTGGR